MIGTTPAFSEVRDWPLLAGSFLTDGDVTAASAVAVLGSQTASDLFGDAGSAIGRAFSVRVAGATGSLTVRLRSSASLRRRATSAASSTRMPSWWSR